MLIHPLPDPIFFSIGPLSVRWYGLMYVLAFTQFIVLGAMRMKQPAMVAHHWTKEQLEDLLFYGALGVIVGGRLGEVLFYHPLYYATHPFEIIAVWKGGMSFHGGFLGVVFAVVLWARRVKRNVWDVLDFIAPLVPLGYAFGRLGNFINAELPGRFAHPDLPWAMIWSNIDSMPRHPSPLYQALVDGLLLFIVLWFYARQPRPRMATSGVFALLYGCARFFTEYFRVPDYEVSWFGWTISAGQMLSVPMIGLGAFLLWRAYRHNAVLT